MPISQMREVSAVAECSATFPGSHSWQLGKPRLSDSTSNEPDLSKCKYLSSFQMETMPRVFISSLVWRFKAEETESQLCKRKRWPSNLHKSYLHSQHSWIGKAGWSAPTDSEDPLYVR